MGADYPDLVAPRPAEPARHPASRGTRHLRGRMRVAGPHANDGRTLIRWWDERAPCAARNEGGAVAGNLTGGPHLAGHSWRPPPLAPNGPCPICGTGPIQESVSGPVLRAAVPQPIAAALLLARTLSARERAVFDWLGQGYDNRSIALAMNISERTVKRHVTVILAKLRLESRLQAGLAALLISSASAPSAE
jgi:DNA-binding CsgD family transcriptional regulator